MTAPYDTTREAAALLDALTTGEIEGDCLGTIAERYLSAAREAGAEAMRERAAARIEGMHPAAFVAMDVAQALRVLASDIRALPADTTAREAERGER